MKRQCIHGNGNKRNNELLSSNDIPDAEINGDDHFSILFWWYGLHIFYLLKSLLQPWKVLPILSRRYNNETPECSMKYFAIYNCSSFKVINIESVNFVILSQLLIFPVNSTYTTGKVWLDRILICFIKTFCSIVFEICCQIVFFKSLVVFMFVVSSDTSFIIYCTVLITYWNFWLLGSFKYWILRISIIVIVN